MSLTYITAAKAIVWIASHNLDGISEDKNKNIARAELKLFEALRSEKIKIYGKEKGHYGEGHLKIIPLGYLLRDKISFDLSKNELQFFQERTRTSLVPGGIRLAGEPCDWEELKIKKQDVLTLWPSNKKSKDLIIVSQNNSRVGRPSNKEQIIQALESFSIDSRFWKLHRSTQAEKIAKKCGKSLGERGWSDRSVQRYIAKYESHKKRH